jgi:hypothetical protein
MLGVQSGASSVYSLAEFEVYGGVTPAPAPPLILNPARATNGTISLSWPTPSAPFILESASGLSPPVVWTPLTNAIANQNGSNQTTITPVGDALYFRLKMSQP